MTTLRRREFDLQIDTLKILGTSGLRCTFKATKTLKPEPNTLDVSVYNLSADKRAALAKLRTPVVVLSAGYEGETTQIFYGQAVHVTNERSGPDIITTVTTSDGGNKAQKARIHQSFGKGAKPGDVLRALVKALGVKVGNLEATVAKLNAGKAVSMYAEGVTMAGHVPAELTALCRSAGLEWSIQDDQIQILDVGKEASKFATVLTDDLLRSTPSVSSKGIVESSTFLQKDFLPGRQVQLRSAYVEGAFRLEKCIYRGDTHGDDWLVEFEAKGAIDG